MRKATLVVLAALAGAGCSAQDDGARARQDAMTAAIAADLTDNYNEQGARIAELEARVSALERGTAARQGAGGSPGSWIAWEVETVQDSPNNGMGVWIPPKPMYAYSTQEDCTAAANRVGLENGGAAETPGQFLKTAHDGSTRLVTVKCLPKEIDPRRLD
jgi:hypothetical protein